MAPAIALISARRSREMIDSGRAFRIICVAEMSAITRFSSSSYAASMDVCFTKMRVPRTRARTLLESICRRKSSQWERKVWHVRNPIIGVRNQIIQHCRDLIFIIYLGLVRNDSHFRSIWQAWISWRLSEKALLFRTFSQLAWGGNLRLLLVETILFRRIFTVCFLSGAYLVYCAILCVWLPCVKQLISVDTQIVICREGQDFHGRYDVRVGRSRCVVLLREAACAVASSDVLFWAWPLCIILSDYPRNKRKSPWCRSQVSPSPTG
jgi:hypothetical protein